MNTTTVPMTSVCKIRQIAINVCGAVCALKIADAIMRENPCESVNFAFCNDIQCCDFRKKDFRKHRFGGK